MAATTPGKPGTQLLSDPKALREADDILAQFPVIYPNEADVADETAGRRVAYAARASYT